MSVEAASQTLEAAANLTAPVNAALESEIVTLLKEQNALLRELVAVSRPPKSSRFTEEEWARAKAIAARVISREDARHVVIDVETGDHATGRTIFAAAGALGVPPERTVALLADGGALRLHSPGRRIG